MLIKSNEQCECECKPELDIVKPDKVEGPLTQDFQEWLSQHEYYEDLAGFGNLNSFGGRKYKNQPINKRPVVFIHGNSDGALAGHGGDWNSGWSNSISYFMSHGGYTTAELYAITYGVRDITKSIENKLTCGTATRLRRFVDAVLAYTGAKEIDIIAHSMGVTYARIIIQGNMWILHRCQLGDPLKSKINKFIAIAGANNGLCICADSEGETTNDTKRVPACSKEFGFWTGPSCPEHTDVKQCNSDDLIPCSDNYGDILRKLDHSNDDAKYIASFWSTNDTIIGPTNKAYGWKTSIVVGTKKEIKYDGLTHYTLKTDTVRDQLKILQLEL
uniref:Lipase n=1 Tax=Meloidogyne incognita TaxID=6306 RepID=A0A914MGK9_MELIC